MLECCYQTHWGIAFPKRVPWYRHDEFSLNSVCLVHLLKQQCSPHQHALMRHLQAGKQVAGAQMSPICLKLIKKTTSQIASTQALDSNVQLTHMWEQNEDKQSWVQVKHVDGPNLIWHFKMKFLLHKLFMAYILFCTLPDDRVRKHCFQFEKTRKTIRGNEQLIQYDWLNRLALGVQTTKTAQWTVWCWRVFKEDQDMKAMSWK